MTEYLITLKDKNTNEWTEEHFKDRLSFRKFIKQQIENENDDINEHPEFEIKAVYELKTINDKQFLVPIFTALNKISSLWWDDLYEYLS